MIAERNYVIIYWSSTYVYHSFIFLSHILYVWKETHTHLALCSCTYVNIPEDLVSCTCIGRKIVLQ